MSRQGRGFHSVIRRNAKKIFQHKPNTVINLIYEDHSAKTFNRPQWKRFFVNVKKYKNKINLVLL